MSWSTKRDQVMEYLNCLELFGEDKQFPLRVLDSIRELKADMENVQDQLSFERTLLQVDPLLKHMGKKYPDLGQVEIVPVSGMADTVSMEDVIERIREIIDSCLTENRQKCQIYAAEQETAVLEMERKLREIQHTQSHYEDIKNVGRFQNFCGEVETNYNTRAARSMNTYADVLWQNCDGAVARIKAILTKLKDEKVHVSEREFWNTFGSKTDLVKERIRSVAVKQTREQNAVSRWAAALIPKLNQSRKKLFRNRMIGILAPLALILVFMIVSNLGGSGGSSVSGSADGGVENSMFEAVADKIVDKIVDKIGDKVQDLAEDLAFGFIKVFLAALLAVLYAAVYIPIILSVTKKGFCNEVAGYLVPDMERFLQETDFHAGLTERYESVNAEAEQACQEILSSVLSRTEITGAMQVRSEGEEFAALCGQWEMILKMA